MADTIQAGDGTNQLKAGDGNDPIDGSDGRDSCNPAGRDLRGWRVCVAYGTLFQRMGVLVQIRDVPEEVHRTLKARAAAAGLSLSEYLRGVLTRTAARPTPAELAARIQARGAAPLGEPSEAAVRAIRDSGE
jgi:plasmid stability protein